MKPRFSIIILKSREQEFIDCLDSVLSALEKFKDDSEILIVGDNIGYEFSGKAKLLQSNGNIPSKRNIGIMNANGEFIVFIDDDTIVPKDFFENLEEIIQNTDSDIYGGPNISLDPSTLAERAQEVLLSNRSLSGGRRKFVKEGDFSGFLGPKNFSFCNIAIKKEIFDKIGFLNEEYAYSEDFYFLEKAYKSNTTMYFDNRLFVYHKRRKTFYSFFKQMYNFGKFNMIYYLRSHLTLNR